VFIYLPFVLMANKVTQQTGEEGENTRKVI